MEKAIITVLGHDKVGIIGKVCTYLSESQVNILDISQTILDGFFSMILVADLTALNKKFDALSDELEALGKDMGLEIKIQHAAIFDSMHRI